MSVVQLADIKAHLNLTTNTDDDLLTAKIAAAEDWIGKYIGTALADLETVDDSTKEAVRQLAAHLYQNREALLVGVTAQELPFGLLDLLALDRAWCF